MAERAGGCDVTPWVALGGALLILPALPICPAPCRTSSADVYILVCVSWACALWILVLECCTCSQ